MFADDEELEENGMAEDAVGFEQAFGVRAAQQYDELVGRIEHFAEGVFVSIPHRTTRASRRAEARACG